MGAGSGVFAPGSGGRFLCSSRNTVHGLGLGPGCSYRVGVEPLRTRRDCYQPRWDFLRITASCSWEVGIAGALSGGGVKQAQRYRKA